MLTSELRITFTRVRTWALLGLLAALPILIAIALRVSEGPRDDDDAPMFFEQVTNNGVFAALAALTVATGFLLPLVVAVVAGDAIAGEASLGTLRYLLVRPVGRPRLLGAKFITVVVVCIASGLAVVGAGLAIGALLFPVGTVTTLSGTTISTLDGIVRIVAAGAIVGVSMVGLAAIGLFVSTLTSTPVAAMAATLVIAIMSQVLDAIPQLTWLHPWLFTHHWSSFADLMRVPVFYDGIVSNLWLQAAYLVVFGVAAWARFTSKDIVA